MSYTLSAEHPDFPDDTEFGVLTLGRVKNHGTLEVDEETERLFVTENGMTLAEAFKNNAVFTLSGNSYLTDKEVAELIPEPTEGEQPQQVQGQVQTEIISDEEQQLGGDVNA